MSALIILRSEDSEAVPLPPELAVRAKFSWSRGEPKRRGGVYESSGHTLSLSEADIDQIDQQLRDITAFLAQHQGALRTYLRTVLRPSSELVLTACILPSGAAVEVTLPAELVATAGDLGTSISVRTFLADDGAA